MMLHEVIDKFIANKATLKILQNEIHLFTEDIEQYGFNVAKDYLLTVECPDGYLYFNRHYGIAIGYTIGHLWPRDMKKNPVFEISYNTLDQVETENFLSLL